MSTRTRTLMGRGLLAAGALLLVACVAWIADAHFWQDALGRRLRALEPHAGAHWLAGEAGATRREVERTGLVGRIEIPRLGVSAIVVEGTAFPGERGNVGLAGHRDTYFGALGDIAKGDRVRVVTPDGAFDYSVESVAIVTPDRVDVLAATDEPSLTLVTCYPFQWVGPAPRRYVIRARADRSAIAHTPRRALPAGA